MRLRTRQSILFLSYIFSEKHKILIVVTVIHNKCNGKAVMQNNVLHFQDFPKQIPIYRITKSYKNRMCCSLVKKKFYIFQHILIYIAFLA